MPRGTILEKLTFGDVLESADQIIAHADALKVRLRSPWLGKYQQQPTANDGSLLTYAQPRYQRQLSPVDIMVKWAVFLKG